METSVIKIKVPINQRRSFVMMYSLFFALIIGNLTNYISLLWISDDGTTSRQMINYILGPILLWIFSGTIFNDVPSEKVHIRSIWINRVLIGIMFIIVFIFCNLNIKFEEEKNVCLKEQTKENLIKCMKEKEDFGNRFNISKLF